MSFFYLGNNEVIEDTLNNIDLNTDDLLSIKTSLSNIDLDTDKLEFINSNIGLINTNVATETTLTSVNSNISSLLSVSQSVNSNVSTMLDNINTIKNNSSNVDLIYDYNVYYTPHYQRHQGNSYSSYQYVSDLSTYSAGTIHLALSNPSSSGKTAYIYNISLSIQEPVSTTRARYSIRKITATTNGSTPAAINNFNTNSSNTTDMNLRYNTSIFTTLGTFDNIYLHTYGNNNFIDFQEEFIQVTENKGIALVVEGVTDTPQAVASIRWFEI